MNYLHTKGQKILSNNEEILLRGMGLGGWFLPEGYMWKLYSKCDRPRRMEALIQDLCGTEYADHFWNEYYNSYITEADIRWISEQGLNSVRIALNARHLFDVIDNNKPIFHTTTVDRLDACIQWCRKYGIYAFLDMHAAPGGQTGQNIDDSEKDVPELFCDKNNQTLLVLMWKLLASRYAAEPAVGGYDLLNEPLPEWQKQYNDQLLPLYRSIIHEIRKVDKQHIIILEGLHWDTDFSVFNDLTSAEAQDNIVFEFHKYWSNPDQESLSSYINTAKRFNAPLWMGEGGENNLAWYTSVFPLYERLGIGWCFWSYKKMDSKNSPVTFRQPQLWNILLSYLDGGDKPDAELAESIFESLLYEISNPEYQPKIIWALLRKPRVVIPAYAYDQEKIINTPDRTSIVKGSIDFRTDSKAEIFFRDGHTGSLDWRRYGGEQQPDDQCLVVSLKKGDAIGFLVNASGTNITLSIKATGTGTLLVQGKEADSPLLWKLACFDTGIIWLSCSDGKLFVEEIEIS